MLLSSGEVVFGRSTPDDAVPDTDGDGLLNFFTASLFITSFGATYLNPFRIDSLVDGGLFVSLPCPVPGKGRL